VSIDGQLKYRFKVKCIYFQLLPFQTNIPTHCITFITSKDINHTEALNWMIPFAVVVVWVLVYMCMISGTVCSGKLDYYQLLFIYIYIYIYIYMYIYICRALSPFKHYAKAYDLQVIYQYEDFHK
jgi:amino acid transporter